MKLKDKLRAKMQAALDRQKALIELAETENRELTADEQKEYDDQEAAYASAEKEFQRADALDKKVEAQRERTATAEKAAKTDVTGRLDAVTEPANHTRADDRIKSDIDKMGVLVWAVAKAKEDKKRDALDILDAEGFQKIADWSREEASVQMRDKSFLTTGGSSGGNTVFVPLSTDFIDWLRNASAFMAGGPVPVDLSFGKLDIPGGLATTSAAYATEVADSGYTEATTRKVSLSAKHLKAHTAVSNYNLEVSPLAIATLLGDDLAMSWVSGMDAAGLRGDGSGANPSGILSLVNAANKTAPTSATTVAPTYTQIETDAKIMLVRQAASNIPRRRLRWVMPNRIKYYLQFLRDGNGNLLYPGLQAATPTWLEGIPVIVSEVIPTNLGTGTNETELYLIDFGHVLIGTARALALKASTEASYKDAGGTLVSAFSRDETVIRATGSHDFAMRFDKAAQVLNTVKWGG